MARDTFMVEIDRYVRDDVSVDAVKAQLIADVIAERDALIAAGEASSRWTRKVNGTADAPESDLQPGGAIIYNFSDLSQAVILALETCRNKSPVSSGDYRDAWIVMVTGGVWTGDLEDLPSGVEVTISNPVPYARKIDVGAMKMSVPPGIIEAARQTVQRKFAGITAERRFLNLSGHYGKWQAPYLLKGNAQRKLAQLNPRSSVFRRGERYLARRRDLGVGQPITYPSLVLSEK